MGEELKKNGKYPLIYVVILNYNGTRDTVECVQSLLQLDYPNYRILVIDNGSAVSCLEEIKKTFPGVVVMDSGGNLGFAGGCTLGIRFALDRGAEYVWLLNNDTVVEAESLTALVQALEQNDECGIVGSKVLAYGTDKIDSAGGRILPFLLLHGWTKSIGNGETDRGQYDQDREVDYAPGVSLLIRAETMRETGMMEERYFLYFEETDWCLRVKRMGWKIRYCHQSVVHHKGSQSMGGRSPLQNYYCARNYLFFIRKHYPFFLWTALFWWPRYFWVNHWIHGRPVHQSYCKQALWDFIRNKAGKMTEGMTAE
ncbi:MAG TPA: glycosyltransferase family 2 protein [Bacillota bacterium]|nr:glycosyltransferase family 2 protein [Bacillota bacterium]